LMTFGKTTESTCQQLETAWRICQEWAKTRGMQFAPEKSELMHLTRAHVAPAMSLRLDDALIRPVTEARFLGVWLDRKLRWKAHLKAIRRKFSTQKYALTKLTASAWGCSLRRAREIYTSVIRSALAYGAGVWHQPSDQKPKGISAQISILQSECLRTVCGAYRATPIRSLETEAAVPPIDLYLNLRVAEFEQRIRRTGKDVLIKQACAAVANRLRRRRRRRTRGQANTTSTPEGTEYSQDRTRWADSWVGQGTTEDALLKD